MFIGLHVKYRLLLYDFNDTWFFSTVFRIILKFKFHENPFSGIRVVPREQTDGQTDMTKLIVAFRNFAKTPKNKLIYYFCRITRFSSVQHALSGG
jgi:hypothetical protein